ncbi:MAG: hypothetical protein ACOC1K_05835 [Nanoarchaeota archaeon]
MDIEKIKNYDWVLIVAIALLVVALANFIFVLKDVAEYRKFTGYDVETGKANLSVESEANIAFFVNGTDWGSGRVNNSEDDYANLTTEGDVYAGDWDANNQPLVLHNIGNSNVSLDLRADKTADDFIGGTVDGGPLYLIRASNNETDACTSIANFNDYEDINTSDQRACDELQYSSDKNSMNLDIKLKIPSDASEGTKESIITATGEAIE